MKEVEVEGQKVLVARDQGAYYALSSKCTHFGASLAKGIRHFILSLTLDVAVCLQDLSFLGR